MRINLFFDFFDILTVFIANFILKITILKRIYLKEIKKFVLLDSNRQSIVYQSRNEKKYWSFKWTKCKKSAGVYGQKIEIII